MLLTTLGWLSAGRAAAPAFSPPGAEIQEVAASFAADPNVQYVVIRALRSGDFSNYRLQILDPSGVGTGTALFDPQINPNVVQVAAGTTFLLGSRAAQTFFNVGVDFFIIGQGLNVNGTVNLLNASGGLDDQFVYGLVPPQNPNIQPFNLSNLAATAAQGLPRGAIAQRFANTSGVGQGFIRSGSDFLWATVPWPKNSLSVVGLAPASTCGNGALEALEQCDTGATVGTPGDPCLAGCLLQAEAGGGTCGNGLVEIPEQCDDSNLVNHDGCSSLCRFESRAPLTPPPTCGNGVLEPLEQCEPRSTPSICDPNCQLLAAPSCGDAVLEAGEQCDLGSATNGLSGATCSGTCQFTASRPAASCGNGVVEPGEMCDLGSTCTVAANPALHVRPNCNDANSLGDPNLLSGCSAQCRIETVVAYSCGDGRTDPNEACDDGPLNGATGDPCSGSCRLRVAPRDAILAANMVRAAALASPQPTPASAGGSGAGGTATGAAPAGTAGPVPSAAPTGPAAGTGSTPGSSISLTPAAVPTAEARRAISCSNGGAPGGGLAAMTAAWAWLRRRRKNF
jgi:MYXO-CTERM domain-containing protein